MEQPPFILDEKLQRAILLRISKSKQSVELRLSDFEYLATSTPSALDETQIDPEFCRFYIAAKVQNGRRCFACIDVPREMGKAEHFETCETTVAADLLRVLEHFLREERTKN